MSRKRSAAGKESCFAGFFVLGDFNEISCKNKPSGQDAHSCERKVLLYDCIQHNKAAKSLMHERWKVDMDVFAFLCSCDGIGKL